MNKSTFVGVLLLGLLVVSSGCKTVWADAPEDTVWSDYVDLRDNHKDLIRASFGREPFGEEVYLRMQNGCKFPVSGSINFKLADADDAKKVPPDEKQRADFQLKANEKKEISTMTWLADPGRSPNYKTEFISVYDIRIKELKQINLKPPGKDTQLYSDSTDPALRTQRTTLTVPSDVDEAYDTVHFGQDYLRVVEQYLYLTPHDHKQLSYYCSIGVVLDPSKDAVMEKFNTVDFGAEPDEKDDSDKVYSARGEHTIIPGLALNVRAPIVIRQEVRTLNRNSKHLSVLQTILGSVAQIFGGPFGVGLSRFSGHVGDAQQAFATYEQNTELFDHNDYEWNSDDQPYPALSKKLLAVFAHGKSFTMVREKKISGSKADEIQKMYSKVQMQESMLEHKRFRRIKEMDIFDDPHLGKYWKGHPLPEYNAFVPDINSPDVDEKPIVGDVYYPLGDVSYVVLRLELFEKYPNIENRPEEVPGTAAHFAALDAILKSIPQKASGATPSKAAVTAPPSPFIPIAAVADENAAADTTKTNDMQQKLIDDEGQKLLTTLHTLTTTGELSLDDAMKLVTAFCKRAKKGFLTLKRTI